MLAYRLSGYSGHLWKPQDHYHYCGHNSQQWAVTSARQIQPTFPHVRFHTKFNVYHPLRQRVQSDPATYRAMLDGYRKILPCKQTTGTWI